jgi:hypothetical protein
MKKVPPKVVALESVPAIPISRNIADLARRESRLLQIQQLYTPREFKHLRDEQMKLILPESPLKTTQGRVRLSLLLWVYISVLVIQ